MTNASFADSLRLLATRRFGTFWFASLLSNIGTWAQQVAQPWLLLSLGASPVILGLDAFASGGPVLLLTMVGGALADRGDRRRVIALCQGLQMLCPVAVVALLLPGALRPWMIVALSLVVGVTDALSMPSFQTIVSTLVEPRELPTGIALNSTQFNLSRILGPAVAGLLMASLGAAGAYAVSAVSYVPFIAVALWILPTSVRQGRATVAGLAPWVETRAVLADPGLRCALLTVLATGLLCAPLVTFCPVLLRTAPGGGVAQFSVIVAAFGAGGLLGAVAMTGVDPLRDRRPLAGMGALSHGAMLVLASRLAGAWSLPAIFCLAGCAMTVSNASANAHLQSRAAPGLRGEAVGLFMIAMRGGVAVGNLVAGFTVSAIGVRNALLANGLLALAAHATLAAAWRRASGSVTQAAKP